MDRLLTINGKTYKAAEFDLNLICDFEDSGISLDDFENKMFSVVRQYLATSMGVEPKVAGAELSAHIANGGTVDEISDVMKAQMESSGFFRTTSKNKDQTNTKRATKKTESEEVIS